MSQSQSQGHSEATSQMPRQPSPEPFIDIGVDQWLETATRHQAQGYRLIQMTGTARPDHFEIMVSFDKDYACANYRVLLPRDNPELPSLTGIFPGAFTYENELKDLFGFSIPGLSIDYGGNFLRTKTKLPFVGSVTTKKEKAGTEPPPAASAPSEP